MLAVLFQRMATCTKHLPPPTSILISKFPTPVLLSNKRQIKNVHRSELHKKCFFLNNELLYKQFNLEKKNAFS